MAPLGALPAPVLAQLTPALEAIAQEARQGVRQTWRTVLDTHASSVLRDYSDSSYVQGVNQIMVDAIGIDAPTYDSDDDSLDCGCHCGDCHSAGDCADY